MKHDDHFAKILNEIKIRITRQNVEEIRKLIEAEAVWCENNLDKSDGSDDYKKGFIRGLRHASYFTDILLGEEIGAVAIEALQRQIARQKEEG